MTRPIYEPSLQRTDRRLTYTSDQLLRRPAPQSEAAAGTTSAYFDTWTSVGTGASVANNDWVEVVTGVPGSNVRWFDEFAKDPAGDWGRNFANGRITNTSTFGYLYEAWGYVSFDVPNGTLIGAALNWVGMEVRQNTTTAVDGIKNVEVIAGRYPMPADGVSLQCYQASGVAHDILEARLIVRRFELVEDVYEFDFAT